jgi:hypothetical protein
MASSIDGFPFVGPVPLGPGNFISAGYSGHGTCPPSSTQYQTDAMKKGMPRTLLFTAHLALLILDFSGVDYIAPALTKGYPPLPQPYLGTPQRVEALLNVDADAYYEKAIDSNLESAKEPFCNGSLRRKAR